ncbi:hypothetical protein Hanom_Chr09g00766481 [Helianthus anomalus]
MEKHFYVACFNVKHIRVGVLDKRARGNTLNIKKKYDGWVETLKMLLQTTCLFKKHPMAKIMKSALIVRQKMDWRIESNGIDCEIFAMRHMETYMELLAGWECGLEKEDAPNDLQQKQLNNLRIKYIAKILLHSLNENRRKLVKSLNKFLELGVARIS